MPLRLSRNMLHGWKDNSVLVKPLAARTHLSSIVSELFEPQVQNIAVFTYRSPHFCFPWRRPCDYHPICSMDGKTIQCLPNPSQHVPTGLPRASAGPGADHFPGPSTSPPLSPPLPFFPPPSPPLPRREAAPSKAGVRGFTPGNFF